MILTSHLFQMISPHQTTQPASATRLQKSHLTVAIQDELKTSKMR